MTQQPNIEITDEMVEAGVRALSLHLALDDAFSIGGEDCAVRAVLETVLGVSIPDNDPSPDAVKVWERKLFSDYMAS